MYFLLGQYFFQIALSIQFAFVTATEHKADTFKWLQELFLL